MDVTLTRCDCQLTSLKACPAVWKSAFSFWQSVLTGALLRSSSPTVKEIKEENSPVHNNVLFTYDLEKTIVGKTILPQGSSNAGCLVTPCTLSGGTEPLTSALGSLKRTSDSLAAVEKCETFMDVKPLCFFPSLTQNIEYVIILLIVHVSAFIPVFTCNYIMQKDE